MTSTTDTAGHRDVEELSDLSEGLLPPSRAAEVRRHLDECTPCADTFHSLEDIRRLLGASPGPPRMPDDVANRIDAALAAEAFLSIAAPDTTEVASAEPAVAHVSRETASTSSADRPAGRAHAATGPGRTKRTRPGHRRTGALGAAVTAAAVGLGLLLAQTLGNDTGKTPAATPQHTDAAHNYSEGTLQNQVANLLAGKTDESSTGGAKPWGVQSAPRTSDPMGMQPYKTLRDTAVNVPSCIQQAIAPHQTVLAADSGVYRGTTVYLLVTPDDSDSTKVTAYLIDAACVKQASASRGKVLLTHSYTRS